MGKKFEKTLQQNIGIITKPIDKAGLVPLSNLIDAIHPLSDSIFVITGGEGMNLSQRNCHDISLIELRYSEKKCILFEILNYIILQLKMSASLLQY
jgi:hypothetical protein